LLGCLLNYLFFKKKKNKKKNYYHVSVDRVGHHRRQLKSIIK
jgi:hypothetical protein